MSKKNTASLGVFTRIVGSQWFVSVISVVIAFLIGAILLCDVPRRDRGPAGIDLRAND